MRPSAPLHQLCGDGNRKGIPGDRHPHLRLFRGPQTAEDHEARKERPAPALRRISGGGRLPSVDLQIQRKSSGGPPEMAGHGSQSDGL
ncbi:hypothetical protein SDC9_201223 [bioreactor metagenome]|uniref:Uncharacterized protein n=1 Tax=bioreactor metagenome TaxID=1076179 RepID=A0A645IT40_9ZZZZ